MTVREWAVGYCVEHGMFEDQAREIVNRVVADPSNEPMAGRWDNGFETYPDFMLKVLAMSLNFQAVKYIDEKCPGRWNRELFEGKAI